MRAREGARSAAVSPDAVSRWVVRMVFLRESGEHQRGTIGGAASAVPHSVAQLSSRVLPRAPPARTFGRIDRVSARTE